MRPPQRKYTDEDKTKALTVLAMNSGNVLQTAKQLGLHRKTLSSWALGIDIKPIAIKAAEEQKKTLAEKYDELAELGLDITINRLKNSQTSIEPERALDLSERAVKTAKLLRGEPTHITQQGTPSEYKEKLEVLREMRAKRDERRLAKVS